MTAGEYRRQVVNVWTVGEYTFTECLRTWKGTTDTVYEVSIAGKRSSTLYRSLDMAMVAAVGEKYTGPRGASGSAVGTAADWFARMIGMEN